MWLVETNSDFIYEETG